MILNQEKYVVTQLSSEIYTTVNKIMTEPLTNRFNHRNYPEYVLRTNGLSVENV